MSQTPRPKPWRPADPRVVPFTPSQKAKDNDHRELFSLIRRGDYSLDGPEFAGVSGIAKDLIVRLMTVAPEQRATASNALEHRWMRLPNREVSTAPLPTVSSRLQETASKMRLPLVTFEPGEFILRAGQPHRGHVSDPRLRCPCGGCMPAAALIMPSTRPGSCTC